MGDVAALGTLLAYDPATEKHLIQAKLQELGQKVTSTDRTVSRMVRESQIELMASINARLSKIEGVFANALPPPSVEERQENADVFSSAKTGENK